jgi:protein-tyrosine phosphatase
VKFAAIFSIASLLLCVAALVERGGHLVLLWPALSLGLAAAAYAGAGPGLFGKRPDGTLHPLSVLGLFPFFGFSWLIWHVSRLASGEEPFHRLAPRIWIGRRLLHREYPEGVEAVVDLTCEFQEPRLVRSRRIYRSFPVLDGGVPEPGALVALVREIQELAVRCRVYIHCAEGHGRTGTVAAALLIALGDAPGPEEALRLLRERRPTARLSGRQVDLVHTVAPELIADDGP